MNMLDIEAENFVRVDKFSVNTISAFKNPSNSDKAISSADFKPNKLGKISLPLPGS